MVTTTGETAKLFLEENLPGFEQDVVARLSLVMTSLDAQFVR
jgi:hypothetical protein